MSDQVRVVIVEDQWMIRDGLSTLAETAENIEVVATGADGLEAISLVDQFEPDVVLMDIRMPNLDGISATRTIRESHPATQVLVLTTFEEDELIRDALGAGAVGYLTKDIAAEGLAEAITTAAKGIVQLTPSVTARLLDGATESASDEPDLSGPMANLTTRELDVLRLLATGASNPEIARQLHLSPGTVKNHVSSILRQLGIGDRTQAAVIAAQHHLT